MKKNADIESTFFYHSDFCGSREQSQTCLSYAEMKQRVRSKHLGSASWNKERFGKPFASERAEEARSGIFHITTTYVQHLQYMPYGEPYVDQRHAGATYSERFRFNGKEKDWESSLHYYGARYYWSEVLTGWLSVDPMSDKYPNISSYAYCVWNPVRVVDPDGQDVWDKVAGFCIGVLTNVSPRTGWIRDAYVPTNSADYNNSLRTADNTMMFAGGLMTAAGTAGIAAGATIIGSGGTVAMTGVGLPEGAVAAAAGATIGAASAVSGLIGSAVTMQATSNASQGYNRGGQKVESAKLSNKEVASEAKKMGMKPTKRMSHGEAVYKKDNRYYSYDNTSHKGGMWKVFELKKDKLQRIGTADRNLKIIGE